MIWIYSKQKQYSTRLCLREPLDKVIFYHDSISKIALQWKNFHWRLQLVMRLLHLIDVRAKVRPSIKCVYKSLYNYFTSAKTSENSMLKSLLDRSIFLHRITQNLLRLGYRSVIKKIVWNKSFLIRRI